MCTRISRARADQQGPGLRYAIAQWLWACCSGGSQERRSDSGCNYAEEKAPRIQQGFSLGCPSLAPANLSSGYADTKIFCARLNG